PARSPARRSAPLIAAGRARSKRAPRARSAASTRGRTATNTDWGAARQHDEFFPTGELWQDQTEPNYTVRRTYRFTGKELDVGAKLYYFGARWYDARLSQWVNPDPMLGAYMRGNISGGVFQPLNLGLYAYTHNNPVLLIDPNGNWPTLNEVKDYGVRLGHRTAGFAYGALQGVTPGGVLLDLAGRPAHSREFLEGQAAGQGLVGGIQVGVGLTAAGAGGGVIVGTGGVAAVTVVPEVAIVGGLAIAGNGALAMAAAKDTANAAQTAPSATGGTPKPEPPQLARGKRAHKEEPVLAGEKAEVPTPSGKRMDRYNESEAHIREIKPNNRRAIKQGEKQVEGYRKEMEKKTGRPHTAEVTPYDPKKYE
ncbi:MAG TPA: RHS repeat-associated core domain-containing protein, partial [Polyangiaceae bacterium]